MFPQYRFSYGSLFGLLVYCRCFVVRRRARRSAVGRPVARGRTAPDRAWGIFAPEEQNDANKDAQVDSRLQRRSLTMPATRRPAPSSSIPPTLTFISCRRRQGDPLRIGVGRQGFTWSGVKQVTRKAEWPDWYPPQEMIARQPYLPRITAGGPGNPLGARAIYLGTTHYRIHGTNAPTTIGKQVSAAASASPMTTWTNLYSRVKVGTKIIVLPQSTPAQAAQSPAQHVKRLSRQQCTEPERLRTCPSSTSLIPPTWLRLRIPTKLG